MSSDDQDLHKPLLLPKPLSSRQEHLDVSGCTVPKTRRRIRHCHSSPALNNPDAKQNHTAWNGNPINSNRDFANQNTRSAASKAVLVLIVYLVAGMICFSTIKDELHGKRTNGYIDALYFCIVTMTTVGYGDLVPTGTLAKLFTCAFVFVGFGLVGLLLGSAADFLVEKQEFLLMKASNRIKHSEDHEGFSEIFQLKKIRWKVAIAGVLVILMFVSGMLFLIIVEGTNLLDAFYCVCVTVTTLGYGDRSFHTLGGRIFAAIWILVSTICLGQFFLYIAELQTESRRQSLVRWVLTRKTTYSDLEAADMDNDGVVSVSEFILFKLKEMGKIEEEDIADIMKEFDELDSDNSGTLNRSDLCHGSINSEDKIP